MPAESSDRTSLEPLQAACGALTRLVDAACGRAAPKDRLSLAARELWQFASTRRNVVPPAAAWLSLVHHPHEGVPQLLGVGVGGPTQSRGGVPLDVLSERVESSMPKVPPRGRGGARMPRPELHNGEMGAARREAHSHETRRPSSEAVHAAASALPNQKADAAAESPAAVLSHAIPDGLNGKVVMLAGLVGSDDTNCAAAANDPAVRIVFGGITRVLAASTVAELVRDAAAQRCLSPAALEILPRAIRGLDDRTIGKEIGRSAHTVHDHMRQIYRVFGVSSRAALLAAWYDLRIPDDREHRSVDIKYPLPDSAASRTIE